MVALNVAVPRELSRLGDHAGRPAPAPPAARGAGLLLVAGDAGVGKTRLVREGMRL